MLNAFLSGKKRGTGLEGETLRSSFSGAEDTLTATVFERLSYLPDRDLIGILFSGSIWSRPDRHAPNELLSIQFWPRLASADAAGQDEPDCILDFDNLVLVVEAKRYDFSSMQEPSQLARYFLSAQLNFPGKDIWILAVGGLIDSRSSTAKRLWDSVQKTLECHARELPTCFSAITWSSLASHIVHTLCHSPFQRLADDICKGMSLHGLAVEAPAWFADFVHGPEWSSVRDLSTSPDFFSSPPRMMPLSGFGGITTSPIYFYPGANYEPH